jgi:hypothetical protein
MNQISFDEFYDTYDVKRNPLSLEAMYNNTMIDFDDDGIDEIEEHDPKNVWTLRDYKEGLILETGITYGSNIIGYFISGKKWVDMNLKYSLI